MKKQLTARSPAKLILSGEHAVVYGKPAIAMAINRYSEVTVRSRPPSAVLFNCLNLKYVKSYNLDALKSLNRKIQNKYDEFLQGRCSIKDVLKMPFELLEYTVACLLEMTNAHLSKGLEIHTSSNIPIGCGMGSSAALVMSTLYALAHFLKLELDSARFLSLGKEAENLQHGYSSGLDLSLTMTGGCLRFEEGLISKRTLPNIPMAIAQTGVPETTTGQCVSFVAQHFKKSSVGEEFAAITNCFDKALQMEDIPGIKDCIRANHQLLVKIGVVPPKIQDFVKALEKEGAAAKICGAGAVAGERAGVVLIVSEKDLSSIAYNYGYDWQQVQGDFHGIRII